MVDFIQIIYNEEQRAKCYPFAKVYHSVGLTRYFENAIIAGLVPLLDAEYISVCSWRLQQKRGDCQIGLGNSLDLTIEKIINANVDVCILTPRSPIHKMLLSAKNWHGEGWAKAFPVFKRFLSTIGITVPDELRYSIYENHFVARRDIYHAYVKEALIPAIQFMESCTDRAQIAYEYNGTRYEDENMVFLLHSKYRFLKNRNRITEEYKTVCSSLGLKDWPIAPFILERLFSIWVHNKGLNIANV